MCMWCFGHHGLFSTASLCFWECSTSAVVWEAQRETSRALLLSSRAWDVVSFTETIIAQHSS